MRDLPSVVDFVRTMRELGATGVSVGDVHVRFDRRPPGPSAPDESLSPEERQRLAAERAQAAEDLLYWSTGG